MSSDTPKDKRDGELSIEEEFEQNFDNLAVPHTFSDRPTPIVPEPSPIPAKTDEDHHDSQKPTMPAPEVDVGKLFSLSTPSSNPPGGIPLPVDVVVQEVADVMAGTHPGLKPSPVPRVYPPDENPQPPPLEVVMPLDEGPVVEVTGEEEMDVSEFEESAEPDAESHEEELSPQEKVKALLQKILALYREMDMDFSSIQNDATKYKWKNKRLSEEHVTFVVLHFLSEFTDYLRQYIDKKRPVLQRRRKRASVKSKLDELAKQLFLRISTVDYDLDPTTQERFRRVLELMDNVPKNDIIVPVAEAFVREVQLVKIFTKG